MSWNGCEFICKQEGENFAVLHVIMETETYILEVFFPYRLEKLI